MAAVDCKEETLIMASPSLLQQFLSIFRFKSKKRMRVDSKWEQALQRMNETTDSIKEQRRHILLLQNTKDTLIDGQKQLQMRLCLLTNGALEPLDGPGKAENT